MSLKTLPGQDSRTTVPAGVDGRSGWEPPSEAISHSGTNVTFRKPRSCRLLQLLLSLHLLLPIIFLFWLKCLLFAGSRSGTEAAAGSHMPLAEGTKIDEVGSSRGTESVRREKT